MQRGILLQANEVEACRLAQRNAFAAGQRMLDIDLDVSKISADLFKETAATEKAKKIRFSMRPTYVDTGQVVVVAFLQDSASREVAAARAFELNNAEQEK